MSTLTKIYDRSGNGIEVHRVEGTLYPKHNLINNFEKRLKAVKQLELRNTDIIQFGFPRSGNHWIYEITCMLLDGTSNFSQSGMGESSLDMMSDKTLEEFKQIHIRRLFTGHFGFHQLSPEISEAKPKCIYILRNPKDAFVSLYHFVCSAKRDFSFSGSLDDFFDLAVRQEFFYGGWFKHVQMAEEFHRQNPEIPFHIVSYENMKQKPDEEIRRLARFLECDDTNVESIARTANFKNMQEKVFSCKNEVYRSIVSEVVDSTQMFRRGEIGQWKQALTLPQNEEFKSLFEQQGKDYSLFDIVKPYI